MLASTRNLQRRPAKVAVAIPGPGSSTFPLARPRCRVVHDRPNERLKLFGAHPGHLTELPDLRQLAGLGKVTAYARGGHPRQWEALGFRREGNIQGFFRDGSDAAIWAAYPQVQRAQEPEKSVHDACLAVAQSKGLLGEAWLPAGYTSDLVGPGQAREVAALMRSIFPVYPTCLSDEQIERLIRSGCSVFRCVRNADNEIVAVASAEMDLVRKNAEMTDCATRPEERGRGLMAHILRQLEADLRLHYEIVDLYSLARAQETGMNCVFKKLGYGYQGRLVNNCRMPSGWESMHIWCKNSSSGC